VGTINANIRAHRSSPGSRAILREVYPPLIELEPDSYVFVEASTGGRGVRCWSRASNRLWLLLARPAAGRLWIF